MASDKPAPGNERDGRSPPPSHHLGQHRLRFADPRAASSQESGEAGLVFITPKEGRSSAKPEQPQAGVVTLSSLPDVDPSLEEAWRKAEGVMAARRLKVREVMEEFGVADVPPAADQLEEQLWQVVEGGITLQEAADLV